MRAECPRLVNSRPTGDASLTLALDSAGAVTRAVVERGTGDARMDEVFGRLAVRLQFERAAGAVAIGPRLSATMGYSCAASGSAITFEVRQPPALERAPADTAARRPPAR